MKSELRSSGQEANLAKFMRWFGWKDRGREVMEEEENILGHSLDPLILQHKRL
jgi:hypothetical protein